ncbi:pentatricopeptide repeat-containing protein [Corchorus olitorius]|uniref:Pentatricopeptide repeat-containing protein n=1 Tax=Corchorus olitorius TaxID=93759 RepID=A0A1R3KPL7_9ROSI|nr:pentatricopeptide repeat-containing protein [Corchorus olitorius]
MGATAGNRNHLARAFSHRGWPLKSPLLIAPLPWFRIRDHFPQTMPITPSNEANPNLNLHLRSGKSSYSPETTLGSFNQVSPEPLKKLLDLATPTSYGLHFQGRFESKRAKERKREKERQEREDESLGENGKSVKNLCREKRIPPRDCMALEKTGYGFHPK